MAPKETWNRGNSLLAIAVLGLAGFAFLPEIFASGLARATYLSIKTKKIVFK